MNAKLILLTIMAFALVSSAFAANNVVFSELQVNALGSDPGLEFIELYNPTDAPIDISGWELRSATVNTVAIPANSIIPSHGFFLITNNPEDAWLAHYPEPDARLPYVALTNSGSGVQLVSDSDEIIDRVGWGPALTIQGYYEGTPLEAQDIGGRSIERKPGNSDETCGNWVDTDNNAADFIVNLVPQPQNSNSATETPCGGEEDFTPPGPVTNLIATEIKARNITWEWTNPVDADFSFNLISLNGENLLNSSTDRVVAFDLLPNTQYTLDVQTIDFTGNINPTVVSDTQTTLDEIEASACSVDADCDNGLFCDGVEQCVEGVCEAGTTISCDNGLFCDGIELCNELTDSCDAGTVVDCSAHDLPEIATCDNNPDNNPLTFDEADIEFASCNEATDSCEVTAQTVTSACSLSCGAGCESDFDCEEGFVCDLNNCGCVDDGLAVCGDGVIEDPETCDDGNIQDLDGCSSLCELEFLPLVVITSPLDGATVTTNDIFVSFDLEHFVIGGKGSEHIHFHVSGVNGISESDHLMFFNGADQIVELNTNPGPTNHAEWVSENTVLIKNVSNGFQTIRAHLATSIHEAVDGPFAEHEILVSVEAPFCGDDIINLDEVCDGSDLGGLTCQDFGYSEAGLLSCSLSCNAFDTAPCVSVCGDGNQEPGESCDDGNLISNDGCSSICEREDVDDLFVNYIRGLITYDGVPAENGTSYTVTVTQGENSGKFYSGSVNDENVFIPGQGNFDTADQLIFSTMEQYEIVADSCNDIETGAFLPMGNHDVWLDCTILPELSDITYEPAKPNNLEEIMFSATATDNVGIVAVNVVYTINNGTNTSAPLENGTVLIGPFNADDVISYYIEAEDTYGSKTQSTPGIIQVIPFKEGDVNRDGLVNIQDIVAIIQAFGLKEGDSGYDPTLDLVQNGIIDIVDIVTVIQNFNT